MQSLSKISCNALRNKAEQKGTKVTDINRYEIN